MSAVPSLEMPNTAQTGKKHTNKCRVCGDLLVLNQNIPKSRFFPSPSRRGRNPICTPCFSKQTREWEKNNRGRHLEAHARRNRKLNATERRIKYCADRYSAQGHRARGGGKEGWVYVIANPAYPGFFKIGKAYSLSRRLNSYQTGSPHRDYYIAGSIRVSDRHLAERAIHEYLLPYRHDGEWFSAPGSAIAAAFDHLREHHQHP